MAANFGGDNNLFYCGGGVGGLVKIDSRVGEGIGK